MFCDADGNELRRGDLVVVVACANTEAEWQSRIVRRVIGFAGDKVIIEWEGGSIDWPSAYCRKCV